jgi:hypothetical protein
MPANPDFRDLLSELSAAGAEFIVVGAHAVMFYTEPRYTKDFDVWVRPTPENAKRVRAALAAFGAPLADLSEDDLASPGTIFQIGVEPNRIDVITSIEAVAFEAAWTRRVPSTYGGVPISLLALEDLIVNKTHVGRDQDKLDVQKLERARREAPKA